MTCTHWFRIALPQGPTSKGKCLRCGEVREFLNSRDDFGPARRVAAHQMYSTPGEKLTALMMVEAYRE